VAEPEPIVGFAAIPHFVCQKVGLTDTAYRVLGALMYFARFTGICQPTNADIGQAAGGLSHDRISRALSNLEEHEVIVIERGRNPRIRGRIHFNFPPEVGGSPELHLYAKSGAPIRDPADRCKVHLYANLRAPIRDPADRCIPPLEPPYMELKKEESQRGGKGCFAEAAEGDLEPFAAPAPDSPPAIAPRPPLPGWRPEDFARLEAEAERLFPLAEFGRRVLESAHLFPADWFARALEAAAMTGKRVGFSYVLGICRSYAQSGGPPPADRSGAGIRPQAPAPPIPAYVEVPGGYKPYPTPKKGPTRD
jgi:hypothetical protein